MFRKKTKVDQHSALHLNQITKVFMDDGIVKFGVVVLANLMLLLFNKKIKRNKVIGSHRHVALGSMSFALANKAY
jgi:hypothetical protein